MNGAEKLYSKKYLKNNVEKNKNRRGKSRFTRQFFYSEPVYEEISIQESPMRSPTSQELDSFCRYYRLNVMITKNKLQYGITSLSKFWNRFREMPRWAQDGEFDQNQYQESANMRILEFAGGHEHLRKVADFINRPISLVAELIASGAMDRSAFERYLAEANRNALNSLGMRNENRPSETLDEYKNNLIPQPPQSPPKTNPYRPGQKIMDYVEEQLNSNLDPERRKWLTAFKLCVLPDNVRDVIEEAITVVLRKDQFESWGFLETFEKGLTNSILIYGPPGTGKTMVTESIAAILGQNLLKLTTGDLQSQIPGEMERNIQHNFQMATEQNAVIMLDECDALLYDRNNVGSILAAEINALLGAIENFSGVVVLTTNRLGVLDPALQRRIIAKVKLDPPELEERKQIWKNLIPKKMPVCESVDTDVYAQHKLTGGEIKNVILLAARRAIARNLDKVTNEHFEHAIATVMEGKQDYESERPWEVPVQQTGPSMGMDKGIIRTRNMVRVASCN